MNERERRDRARFWARLASVESLEEISEAEMKALRVPLEREVAASIQMPSVRQPVRSIVHAIVSEKTGAGYRVFLLPKAHKLARDILPQIAAQGAAIVPKAAARFTWLRAPDGTIQEHCSRDENILLETALGQVVLGSKDLFGVCPECGAVFVRIRRQKYCSPNCTTKALEDARRPDKAKYMRSYRRRQKPTAAERAAEEAAIREIAIEAQQRLATESALDDIHLAGRARTRRKEK